MPRLGGPLHISAVLDHALMEMREAPMTLVIGDVHGCLNELIKLVAKSRTAPVERVIMLGDLVDKGPDSPGVVQYCRENGFELVLGNHEEKLLRWRRHLLKQQEEAVKGKKYDIPVKLDADQQSFIEKLTLDDWAYLSTAKPFIQFADNMVAVHGGLQPGIPLDKQDPKVTIRLRVVNKETKRMMPLNKDLSEPEGSVPWFEAWEGPQSVVFGHRPLKSPFLHKGDDFGIWGIDTSCVFGGSLTGLLYNQDMHVCIGTFSVKAEKAYATDPRDME